MLILSDALPIQWWPIGANTYNESQYAFVYKKPFYQEFTANDVIRLQGFDTVSTSYSLLVTDSCGNQIDIVNFVKTAVIGGYSYDIDFQISVSYPTYADNYLRFYIQDSTPAVIYKSEFIKFSTAIRVTPSWGTELLSYKSNFNFADIKYPVADYFNLRIPCRFYRGRNNGQQTSLNLTNSTTINTSTYRKRQKYLETWPMPDYMLDKIELVLDHAPRGSVMADLVEWVVDESFDRSTPDPRYALQTAKIWLTRKKYSIRNIV